MGGQGLRGGGGGGGDDRQDVAEMAGWRLHSALYTTVTPNRY